MYLAGFAGRDQHTSGLLEAGRAAFTDTAVAIRCGHGFVPLAWLPSSASREPGFGFRVCNGT